MRLPDLSNFAERSVDENNWYENGETFFREACDVMNERTQVECDAQNEKYEDPDADENSGGHEVNIVVPGEKIIYKNICSIY